LADGAQGHQSDNETIVGVDPAALLAPRGLRSHMHQRTTATRLVDLSSDWAAEETRGVATFG